MTRKVTVHVCDADDLGMVVVDAKTKAIKTFHKVLLDKGLSEADVFKTLTQASHIWDAAMKQAEKIIKEESSKYIDGIKIKDVIKRLRGEE